MKKGLTLVELIVVLSVVMLMALAITPRFIRFHQGAQLNWAARRTLALAGEARGLAVSGERPVTLTYDPQAHGLRLTVQPSLNEADETRTCAPPPQDERRTPDSRMLELPLDVAVGVESGSTGGDGILTFFPDGRSEPARVIFERDGYDPIALVMNPRTGRLRSEQSAVSSRQSAVRRQ